MLTITRKDLLLTISDNVIPAMGSSDVPVKFVNDAETYADFLIEPRVGYYVNGCAKSGICEYDTSSNVIKIPAEAFKNKGILVIAIALIDNADSNHIEVTKELALEVTPAPNGTVVLPATDTWQTAVNNLVEQLYNQDYKPQFDEIEENLHNLVKEAQNQQNKANNQQTQIDNAIDVMGDYEIVQDNPTQIRFKKGDGTYGDTVNLGDNLASKSMVNAGYDIYSGNSYGGSASDYGIEIGKASGAYEQDGTPTPENPIEPKFFEPKHIISSGNNLYLLDNFANLNSNFTIDDDGWFVINHTNNTGGNEFFNIFHKPIKELKKNSNYYFTIELEKNIFIGSPTLYINSLEVNSSNSTQFKNGDTTFRFDSDNKTVLLTTRESFDSLQYLLRTYLYMPNGSSVDLKFRIILSPSENTSFETYKPIYTTPLSLILRALPNGVKDTYENGVVTRRIKEIAFDGSEDEDWRNFANIGDTNRFRLELTKDLSATSANGICNKLPFEANYTIDKEHFYTQTNNIFIFLNKEKANSMEGLKTWLQSNPITIWYELAEPTTEQVDLPVIPSYYSFTNAWHDSEVEASDLTWNILARQYGSGQTTIKKDEAVLTELDLNTERTVSPTTVKVQLKDTSGNTFYVETSADNVYLKGTDGSEITQKSLNDKIGQLINLVAFYSASPVSVLTDLKKYITTIS